MSIAGKRSTQGDEYQLRIALHWLIQLLKEKSIQCIQINSTGIPAKDFSVTVDDVVVLYKDGRTCFIQAKKNQPNHTVWSLADHTLKEELEKACKQLESSDKAEVKFYSRSPFGELKALVETSKSFPDFESFLRNNSSKSLKALERVANIIRREKKATFELLLRFSFGPTNEYEDWDQRNLEELDYIIPQAPIAMQVLERYLVSHEAGLRNAKSLITREQVLTDLAEIGLSPTLKRSEAEILATFKEASCIGRNWLRTVDGEAIRRVELDHIISHIEHNNRTILLTDRPGSGKTCLLLDLADELEKKDSTYGFLFIKGDQFTEINSEEDLVARGLPEDIVGQCARLTAFRHVVVVIDSLDVLSLLRQHSALKVVLGLIDRLSKNEKLTVIAACRNFDLQYDPLLRGRSWHQTVHLQPLDFETVVEPFLVRWEINPSSLSIELRELLQLPQHLRIYEKLAKLGKGLNPASSYELYDSFLDEVIVRDPDLGNKAMLAMQKMADYLVQKRTQSCPKATFEAEEGLVKRLISQEVLWASTPGTLSFSHQTLTDCLIVRSALAKNQTLVKFILDHPQLPFIRPAIRAFFFYLRAYQTDDFRKQVWQVLSNDGVAHHVKRLICESFAEIIPVEEDWRLLRRIFQNYSDLFRRLFLLIEANIWFNFLNRYWLPEAQISENKQNWLFQFALKLKIWGNQYPTEVIHLWREAISSQWAEKQSLIRIISNGLQDFDNWNTEGVRELLEILVKNVGAEHSSLGTVLSRWVQSVDSGDDLLWKYITRSVQSEDISLHALDQKLHCQSHEFCQEKFLIERLKKSANLMNLVLNCLEAWSNDDADENIEYNVKTNFLYKTSWILKHSNHEVYHADNLEILLNDFEEALKYRSHQNDEWWQANELHLRKTQNAALRYFLLESYKENIHTNILGIESQIQDKALFRIDKLNYELGQLMQLTYPYISESAKAANQSIILSLGSDRINDIEEPMLSDCIIWFNKKIYDLLVWIPSIFRILEAQSHITNWQEYFGYFSPSPDINTWGGTVISPISSEELLKLSNKSVFRLLHYYKECPNREFFHFDRDMVGGLSEVKNTLREACSLDPIRFLNLFSCFIKDDLEIYIHTVIEGIATHLRFRFGNLSSNQQWEPAVPLPDGEKLALTLLNLLERNPILWQSDRGLSEALQACVDVLSDYESANRITLLIFWIHSRFSDDFNNSNLNSPEDLAFRALNSIRGVAAECAIKLYNGLLEKTQTIPELLPYLLCYFSHDPAIYVRLPIIENLPFLLYKNADLGWQLLSEIFKESQSCLWNSAERSFYYQYKNNFNKVSPYLNRILTEAMDNAGESWGRISTLSSLAGHINQETLFESLKRANSDAWKGSAQVFVANLDRQEHSVVCHSGLMTMLFHENLSDEVFGVIGSCFKKDSSRMLISHELVLAFLNAISDSTNEYDIHGFLEWLSHKARHDPLFALNLTEILVEKIETKMKLHQIWHTEPLIAALNEILREADEIDDVTLIKRAVDLQDRFLRLDINGIEKLLEESGK
jgi:ATPase family associated with various cellular activities (AAA)